MTKVKKGSDTVVRQDITADGGIPDVGVIVHRTDNGGYYVLRNLAMWDEYEGGALRIDVYDKDGAAIETREYRVADTAPL